MAGFSLVELMLSLSLGLALSGVMLQGLMAEGQTSQRLTRLWRERAWQRRTLELVKSDLLQATAVSASPELEPHACSLAGRSPVLQMSTSAGPITYSVGAAPSAIWRGQVLMRCGPAYGLEGSLSPGAQAQNRVVIDGLGVGLSTGVRVEHFLSTGLIEVRIARSFESRAAVQKIELKMLVDVNGLEG